MRNYLIGKLIRITSDNEGYDAFRDQTLRITHAATNEKEHPGYDAGGNVEGEKPVALCDLETLQGTAIGSSLYEWEFEIVTK